MREITLGTTGIAVSEFFFGAGAIGGIGSPPATRGKGLTVDEGLTRIDEAVDLGIRVLDTANTYAGGESERTIGRWLDERERDDVLIATKVGNLAEPEQREVLLRADHIERQLAASIRRLGKVDLYLSHAPDVSTPLGETIERSRRPSRTGASVPGDARMSAFATSKPA